MTFTLADAGDGPTAANANTFTYTIAETAGSNELFQYAKGTITATVKVYKDASGNLQVEPTYAPTEGKTDGVSVEGTGATATPTFTNTYIQNDTARLYIYKEVIGRTWDTDEFTFTVRAINGGHAPKAATATIRSSDPHHEVEDDVVIRATDFTEAAIPADGKKTQDFIYEIAERLTSTQQQNYISRAPVYAKVTATLDDGVDGSVHVTGVTYWHDEACTIAADTQTETEGGTSTTAVKFTNWNNATAAPTLSVGKVIQNQEGSSFTWAVDDSFSFSVTPVSSNVPGFGELETVAATRINNTNSTYSYTSNSGYQNTCALSLSMADLQRNNKNAPTTTKFIYQISEDVPTQGAISGIGYTRDPVYAEVTATPTDEGALSTTVSYYKNYDTSTGALSNKIEDTNAAPFTNTFGAVNFSVNKTWRDGQNTVNSNRPNDGKITLHLAQTVEGETTTLDALPGKGQVAINGGADKTADYNAAKGITLASDQLPITFSNLPALTSDGKAIEYSVVEDEVVGYTTTYTTNTTDSNAKTITVINTKATKVEGTKVWESDTPADRPDSVVIALLANGSYATNYTLMPFAIVDSDGDGKFEFSDLPAYDAGNELIEYGVVELNVPTGYDCTIQYHNGSYDPNDSDSEEWLFAPSDNWDGKVQVVNELQAGGMVTVEAKKELKNRDSQEGETFSFALEKKGMYTQKSDEGEWTNLSTTNDDKQKMPGFSGGTNDNEPSTTSDVGWVSDGARNGNASFLLSITRDNLNVQDPDTKLKEAKFVYTLTEVQPEADNGYSVTTDASGKKVFKGVTYDNTTYEVEIESQDVGGGHIVSDVTYYKVTNNGQTQTREQLNGAPTFENSYDATAKTWGYVVKHIAGRNFGEGTATTTGTGDDATTTLTGDAFRYIITSVGGAAMNPTEGTSSQVDAEKRHTTSAMNTQVGGSRYGTFVTGAEGETLAFAPNSNQETADDTMAILTGEGELRMTRDLPSGNGIFLYEIKELRESNAEQNKLIYDDSSIFLKIVAHDKGDGTLEVTHEYYTDASCTSSSRLKVDGKVPQVLINKSTGAVAPAGATDDDTYDYMDAAYFSNMNTVDIPVTKEWVGTPLENVTVHLQKARIALNEEDGLDDEAVKAKGEDIWLPTGYTLTLLRSDFTGDATSGTRAELGETTSWSKTTRTEDGKTVTSVSYTNPAFNQNLPMYETVNGVTYRLVYRLVEDVTSGAYTASYRSIQPAEQGGDVRPGDQVFVDSGTMVVTNTARATNTANLGAVKQLIGRDWNNDDSFSFTLASLGKAAYSSEGSLQQATNDSTDNEKKAGVLLNSTAATIPMPESNEATATIKTSQVAVGEHLAQFGGITYNLEDLDYVGTSLKGDFYYLITEDVPSNTKGITYSQAQYVAHVHVEENSTSQLVVSTDYKLVQATYATTDPGNAFTPVFTNTYNATGKTNTDAQSNAAVKIHKEKLGGNWIEGNSYDFVMQAMPGSPFVDANHEADFAQNDTTAGYTNEQIEAGDTGLVDGKAVHTTNQEHRIRLTVKASEANKDGREYAITRTMPSLAFTLSDLTRTVSAENAAENAVDPVVYSDGSRVREGVKYGRFFYSLREVWSNNDDAIMDPDNEYVRITAIDKEDGTIDFVLDYYRDRFGTDLRSDKYAPFNNLATKDITVKKTWDGIANANVTLKLQVADIGTAVLDNYDMASITEDKWLDVNPATELSYTHEFFRGEFDDNQPKTYTFTKLPLQYAKTESGVIGYHNLAYRVVETYAPTDAGKFDQEYTHQYAKTIGGTLYGTTENPLEVKNTSKYSSNASVTLGVAKTIQGRNWVTSDFGATLSDQWKADNTEYGTEWTDDELFRMRVVADAKTGEIDTPMPSGAAANAEGKLEAIQKPNNTTVIAADRRRADFESIVYTQDDLVWNSTTNKWENEFVYTLSEVIPDYARPKRTDDSEVDDLDNVYYKDYVGSDKDSRQWVFHGVTYKTNTFTAVVHIEDVDHTGHINATYTYYNKYVEPGSDQNVKITNPVPSYTNVYDAKGFASPHIVKFIDGREWKAGDEFGYRLTTVGSSTINPHLESAGSQNKNTGVQDGATKWYTPVMTFAQSSTTFGVQPNNTPGDHAREIIGGTGVFRLRELATDANGNRSGVFIFALEEVNPNIENDSLPDGYKDVAQVTDLKYDDQTIYLKVTVTDRGNGTLKATNEFFTSATCEPGTEVQVPMNPTERPLDKPIVQLDSNGNIVALRGYSDAVGDNKELKPEDHGKTWEYSAYFENRYATNIDVSKEWKQEDGSPAPVVDNATVVLKRALVAVDNGQMTIPAKDAKDNDGHDVWQPVENPFRDFLRNEYVATGDNLPADCYFIDENGAVQMYGSYTGSDKNTREWTKPLVTQTYANEELTGQNQRYVYYVEETTTSGAYDASVQLLLDNTPKTDQSDQGVTITYDGQGSNQLRPTEVITGYEGGANATPVYDFRITNTVKAQGKVYLSVVKQLLGREWTNNDTFTFTLRPMGKATYENGEFKSIDTTATIPMPTAHVSSKLADDANNQALASKVTATVDANDAYNNKEEIVGVGERLARFGAIEYKVSDLTESNGAYRGDFWYTIKEDLPTTGNAVLYTYENGTSSTQTTGMGTLKSVTWSDGLTYDQTEHFIHVVVTANKSEQLSTAVYYDQTDLSNTSTGKLYTPVFTNYYDVDVTLSFQLSKSIRGGSWDEIQGGDSAAGNKRFFFEVLPVSGAPFRSPNFDPEHADEDDTHWDITYDVKKLMPSTNDAVTTENRFEHQYVSMRDQGLVRARVDVPASGNDYVDVVLPPMEVSLSDLGLVTDVATNLSYRDGTTVPAGVAYGQFMYVVREYDPQPGDVSYDEYYSKYDYTNVQYDDGTEYAQVTVIDKRDGTLDCQVRYFHDAAATKPVHKENSSELDDKACFSNAITHPLVVRKEWNGIANADSTVRLERRAVQLGELAQSASAPDTTNDPMALSFDGGKTYYAVPKSAMDDTQGAWQTVDEHTFTQAAVYETGKAEHRYDNLVTEETRTNDGGVRTRYGYIYRITETTPTSGTYGENDKYRYSITTDATALAESDNTPALVVTNVSDYKADGTATVSVVKQLIGRDWDTSTTHTIFGHIYTGDTFSFYLTPAGKANYVKDNSGNYVMDARGNLTIDTSSKNTSEGVIRLQEQTLDADENGYEAGHGNDGWTTVGANNNQVSDNEHSNTFANLKFKDLPSSEFTRDGNGNYVADYYYTMSEDIDNNAVGLELVEGAEHNAVAVEHRTFNGNTYRVTDTKYVDWLANTDANKPNYTYWLDRSDGIVYTTQTHEVRIHVVDNGNGNITTQVSYDGRPAGSFTPVYTNYYDAAAVINIDVLKHIVGGNDEGRFNGAYRYELVPMPGAAWGTGINALYTTVELKDDARNDQDSNFGESGDFKADGWYYLSDLNGASEGSFVYAIREVDPLNASTYRTDVDTNNDGAFDALQYPVTTTTNGQNTTTWQPLTHVGYNADTHENTLAYDTNVIYAKVDMSDNGKGVLNESVTYYRDPECTQLITKGDTFEANTAGINNQDPAEFAQFNNTPTRNVTVRKVWANGEAVSDSVIHLQQKPAGSGTWRTLGINPDGIGPKVFYDASKSGTSDTDNSYGWTSVGGGSKAVYADLTWTNLPATIKNAAGEEVDAEYRVIEDATNGNGLVVTYGADYGGQQYDANRAPKFEPNGNMISGVLPPFGKLTVTNTYTATGVGEVNAVKQLLGRDWSDDDSFGFELTAVGMGEYDAGTGSLKVFAGGGLDLNTTTPIPMPGNVKSDEDHKTVTAVAPATKGTIQVAEKEHLASFGEIRFTTDELLVHNDGTGHLQGDFFYTLREVVPNGATATYSGEQLTYGNLVADDPLRNNPDIQWVYNGVTYTRVAHSVHVQVRDYGTGQLTCTTYYDETIPGDTSTATRFTPVFTNRYNVAGELRLYATKTLNYRNIADGETYTVRVVPLAGSPMPIENEQTGVHKQSIDIVLQGDTNVYTNTKENLSEAIPLHEPDTYVYEMYEVLPNTVDPATGIDSASNIQYDLRHVYAKVVVTDNTSTGELVPTVTYHTEASCSDESLIKTGSGSDEAAATSAPFTNAVLRDIEVDKVWKGDAVSDVTLMLQRTTTPEVEDSWETIDTAVIAQNATGNDLRHTFQDKPAFTPDGTHTLYQYRVAEQAGDNYITDAPKALASDAVAVTIHNTNTTTMSFVGTKSWVDGGKDHTQDANTPAITLYRTTGAVPSDPAQGTPVNDVAPTWNDGKTSFTYTNLPQFDANGERYTYWVLETKVDGYENPAYHNTGTNARTDRLENGGTVTNTIAQQKIELAGTKTWNHGGNSESDRPTTVTVHLQANGEDLPNKVITLDGTADSTAGGPADFELAPANGVWNFKFTGLDKYDSNGAEVNYTVREDHVANYKTTYDDTHRNITNTYNTNTLGDILKVSKTVAVPDGDPDWTWGDDDKFVFNLFGVSNTAGITQPMPSGSVYGDEVYKRIEATEDNPSPTFGAVSFDMPGTYVYRVREMTPAESNTQRLPGMTYDTEAYTVTAVVDDAMNISVTVKNKAGESITQSDNFFTMPFTNHFDKTKVDYVMVAEKAYTDRSKLDGDGRTLDAVGEASGKFGFTMRPVGTNAADAPMPSDYYTSTTGTGLQGSGANRVYFAKNVNNRVLFEADAAHAIEFDADHLGTYSYELAEIIPDEAVYIGNGFWYNNADETVYDGVVHTRTLSVAMTNDVLTITPSTDHGDTYLNPALGTKYGEAKSGERQTVPDDLINNAAYPRHKNNVPQFYNYKEPKIAVTATKVWDDANNQDGRRPANVYFYIERNDGQNVVDVYGNTVNTKAKIAGTDSTDCLLEAVWANLPRYKRRDDGTYERITYKVFESADEEPARNSVPGYADQVITGNDESGFTITNKRIPELRGVSVTKQWNDENNRDHKRPESVTFHLDQRKAGESMPTVSDFQQPIVANAANEWTATWLDLPARYGDATKEFEYALREDAIDGYTAGEFVEGNATMQVRIPAGVTPRTDSVTVTLMEDGTAKGSSIVLNAANNWTGTFENIDPSNVSTSGYYDVLVAGTDSGIEKADLQKTFIRNYTITNTYNLGNITATKVWVDANNANNTRKDATFTLKAMAANRDVTKDVMEAANESASKTLLANAMGDALTATWNKMPSQTMVDDVAQPIEYSVSEAPIDGYDTTIEGNAKDGFTVTNRLSGKTKVEGTKVWVDGGRSHDNRHEVTLQLWRRSARAGTTPELTTKTPEWDGDKWSFTDLDAYDSEGYANSYYVVERNVFGYETTYSNPADASATGLALDGGTITNTVSSNFVSFSATKNWVDENNTDGLRADVTLHLERKVGDGSWERMGSEHDKTISVSEGADVTAHWVNMPASHGNDSIEYRVVEEPIDGYTAEVTGNQTDGFVVTNTHTPGTVTIHANKEWDDNNNADKLRPNAVTMHLIASTESGWRKDMGTAEARGSAWKAIWSNMPTHHNGNKITYTVVEEAVPGYAAIVSNVTEHEGEHGVLTYNLTVTNKRVEASGDVSATKVWMDDNNRDGKRENIQLRLEVRNEDGTWKEVAKDAQGNDVKPAEIDKDATGDALKTTWTNLPTEIVVSGQSITTSADEDNKSNKEDEEEAKSENDNDGSSSESQDGEGVTEQTNNESSNSSETPVDEEQSQPASNENNDASSNEQEAVDQEQSENNSSSSTNNENNSSSSTNNDGEPVAEQSSEQSSEQGNPIAGAIMSLFRLRQAFAEEGMSAQASTAPAIYRVVEYHKDGEDWVAGAPEGYVAIISQNEDGSFTVTNIHQPEMRNFTVRKAWDIRGHDGTETPSSVEVQLKANGESMGDVVALTGDEWLHTWNDLYAYENGSKIDYTVEELNVPDGYTSSGEMSGPDQYVITNVYNGTITVVATKQWKDENGAIIAPGVGIATPEVKLQLFKDGVAFGEPKTIPNAAGATSEQMQATWSNLASWENNKQVTYTVEETVGELEGYVARQSSFSNTIAQNGAVEFVNELKPFYATGNTDDPDRVIKVTYVDNLLAEDGNGGALEHGKDLVLVFKTRLGDLDTTVLNKVGAQLTKGAVYTESVGDEVKAEAAGVPQNVPGESESHGHADWTFTGWTINRDQFGDYVMVAHHSKNTHTTYVDGQTGETWDSEPGDPSHDNLKFVGWKEVKDAAGNTIFVAQYEPVAKENNSSSSSSATPRTVNTVTRVPITAGGATLYNATRSSVSPLANTGDDTSYVPIIVLGVLGVGAVGAAIYFRRRK